MHDPQAPLKNFPRKHDRLVCVDSDGTALDTMEIKHKECFIPATIRYWDLQPVARYARAAAEFVNLYSRDRGINRFPALLKTLDLLERWPGVPRTAADPARRRIARLGDAGKSTHPRNASRSRRTLGRCRS